MAISFIVCEIYPSDLLVENREIYTHLYLAPPQGLILSEFHEDVDAGKTRMIGLPYGEKNYDDYDDRPTLSRFHLIAYRNVTDRQTDKQTDGQNCYINIVRQCADAR